MQLTAIVGGAIGAVIGLCVGIVAFGSTVSGIGIALGFGAGIGGVFFAIATDDDVDGD